MRIRPSKSPLLLLLLPSLAASLAIDPKAKPGSVAQLADGEAGSATLPSRPGGIGTKDAPVDGLDGKPHAGPFVEAKKLPPAKVEDLGPKSSLSDEVSEIGKKKTLDDKWEVPKPEDSVMDDRVGEKPNKGPKGTEGGVSEKDRLKQQAGEGKGKSSELKKPEQPKAVPASAEEKVMKGKNKDKSGKKDVDVEQKPKQKGAAGLEVRWHRSELHRNLLTSYHRNHRTSLRNPTISHTLRPRARLNLKAQNHQRNTLPPTIPQILETTMVKEPQSSNLSIHISSR